ncbi:hypothetical protein PACTADRAFT_5197 [Pachysolen tannophilus NRRL Y-2460]|uniref:MHD domain-containing protein n=1 Tax=Pachysolen tannophilus NRRL Y-2460 TaxID=669874 RepID=A0A1E4TNT5_PACTA|nr:hypothetical protein PACTADRAFT_5197 [Pachysolen tannophilus NRRL Y-2460]
MSSAVYILDDNFDIIISRVYKQDLNSHLIISNFKKIKNNNVNNHVPVIHHDGINYIYITHNDIVILTLCFKNTNVMLLLSYLYKFVELLQNYLLIQNTTTVTSINNDSIGKLDKELIKENYILIYQLFDEILDFGIPQLTDFSMLREYILNDNDKIKSTTKDEDEKDRIVGDLDTSNMINSSISRTTTTSISWRPKGIFYKKNEIFINLIEKISFNYNLQTNEIKKNIINGEINCKNYLSGMPICKIGLNESLISNFYKSIDDDNSQNLNLNNNKNDNKKKKIIFDNINFHQCIELSNITSNNLIQFIPPDGFVKLITYQIINISTINLKPLILINPLYKIFNKRKNGDKNGVEKFKLKLTVNLKTLFRKKFMIKNLEISIPLLIKQNKDDFLKLKINFNKAPKFKTKIGNVILNLNENLIIWKIPSIVGDSSGSTFTNSKLNNNDDDNKFEMISEFELIPQDELLKMLQKNAYYDKADNNSLYYIGLQEELSKLNIKNDGKIKENQFKINEKNLNTNNNLIYCNFEIPFASYSGLKLEFLKIVEPTFKESYQSFPWVRYLIKTNENDYCFKLGDNNFVDEINYEDLSNINSQNTTSSNTNSSTPIPIPIHTHSDTNSNTNDN